MAERYSVRVEGAKYGVSFGSALAIAISYTANHSILWAIIHGILSWLYVIYFAPFEPDQLIGAAARSNGVGCWTQLPNDTLPLNSRRPADPARVGQNDP